MGYDAYSTTVLGFHVSKKQAVKEQTTRGCKCKLTEQELKQRFCPHCGKKVLVKETINIKDDLLEDLEDNEDNEGIKVFVADGDSEDFYVGIEIEKVMYLNDILALDFKFMATKLATKLQMYGLEMNINEFGIHNFLYESY